MLIVIPGQVNEATLERVSAPSGTIYGTWINIDQVQNGISLHGEITFQPSLVSLTATCSGADKTAHAHVSSPATITDTTVDILQADADLEYSN